MSFTSKLATAIWVAVAILFARVYLRETRPRPQAQETIVREVVRVDSIFVTDTVRLYRTLASWDTVRVTDTITVNDVVYVPRDVVDTVVAACRETVSSCTRLVQAVRDSARAVGARDWQSAGITLPLGAYYERDFRRLRGGVSAGLDPEGRVRGEIRFGIRW